MVKEDDWIYITTKDGNLIKALVSRKILKDDIVQLRINIHITEEKDILIRRD